MRYIDYFLNKFTMYKLTLYYLIGLIGVAAILSFFGFLNYNPLDILIDVFLAIGVCFVANFIFAKLFSAVTNLESVFITALILVLIIPLNTVNAPLLVLASIVAMAMKYLLTVEKRHVFNPAALSVAAISLLSPEHGATWWVGTPIMLPFVLIGGLLLVKKIQREEMIFNFLIAYLSLISIAAIFRNSSISSVISIWRFSIFDSALFFFLFVMLTEPLTSPATKKKRNYFAYLVAFLYATPILRLGIALTPEIALVLGNVFAFFISPNYRLELILKWKKQISPDTLELAFAKNPDFKFIPGQFMEWTLPHVKIDSRGNRRYFSISSSPTEPEIKMTIKFYNPSSSYKKELWNMQEGSKIIAKQVAGDFVLPQDLNQPLVFIAGGVGIAPFRSMIQYVIDNNLKVNIILLYTNKTREDILFSDIFKRAKQNGISTIYNLTDLKNAPEGWQGSTGYITSESIAKLIPDSQNRFYYLSGPQLMVQRFEQSLLDGGIAKNRIKTDFFPGYNEK